MRKVHKVESRYYTTRELTFRTHDDTIIYANFVRPNDAQSKLPCVVRFRGGSLRRDSAIETVSYFDVNNLASLLKVSTSFCLCLDDPICLSEFIYSVYTHTPCDKKLYTYPYWKHQLPPVHKDLVLEEFGKL